MTKNTPKSRARTQIGTLRDQMAELAGRVSRVERQVMLSIWLHIAVLLALSGLLVYVLWGDG